MISGGAMAFDRTFTGRAKKGDSDALTLSPGNARLSYPKERAGVPREDPVDLLFSEA